MVEQDNKYVRSLFILFFSIVIIPFGYAYVHELGDYQKKRPQVSYNARSAALDKCLRNSKNYSGSFCKESKSESVLRSPSYKDFFGGNRYHKYPDIGSFSLVVPREKPTPTYTERIYRFKK